MYETPEALLHRIRLGEDSSLELKRAVFKGARLDAPRRDELADEIAAIANTGQGTLVFGVDDKTRAILGIPIERLDSLEQTLFEICEQSIRPPVLFTTSRMELPDEGGTPRAILRVEIPRSLFVHESPGGYFHRQGSSKRKLAPELLARLFQQRSQARILRFEEQVVPGTNLSSLDEKLWRRFVSNLPGDPVEKLRKMDLLTQDDAGEERATVAGVLMAAQSPERWLPGAYIEAVRYRGIRQDSHDQVDAQRITGPLDQQIRDALSFARRNMRISARKLPGRVETPDYSVRALFEAIVNAVAHRDYSIHGSKIRLLQFDDRLELYSPGALPNTLTVESLPLRQSTRNELLTHLLSKAEVDEPTGQTGRQFYMEKRGDGVPIILEESRKLSSREPEYLLIDDAELRLTLYAANPPLGG